MPRFEHIFAMEGLPFAPQGHGLMRLEVLRVERIRPDVRRIDALTFVRPEAPGRLHLEGVPGSAGSVVRRAELVFLHGVGPPAPVLDLERKVMRLYYPASELHHVMDVLAQRARHLCYLVQPAKAERALAMILASR